MEWKGWVKSTLLYPFIAPEEGERNEHYETFRHEQLATNKMECIPRWSLRTLSNEHLFTWFGVCTAENGPSEVVPCYWKGLSANLASCIKEATQCWNNFPNILNGLMTSSTGPKDWHGILLDERSEERYIQHSLKYSERGAFERILHIFDFLGFW